jgi:transcriptional regulator with XRE-family HTH domain
VSTPPIPGLQARLREARERRGLSIRGAARMMECSPQWLGQMENGERSVSVPWLARFASLYTVSTDWLIGG